MVNTDFIKLLALMGDDALGRELETIGAGLPQPSAAHIEAFLRLKYGERDAYSAEEVEAATLELRGRMLHHALLDVRRQGENLVGGPSREQTAADERESKILTFKKAWRSSEERRHRHEPPSRRGRTRIVECLKRNCAVEPWRAAALRATAGRPLASPSLLEGREAPLDALVAGDLLQTSLSWARGPVRILAFYDGGCLRSVRVDIGVKADGSGEGKLMIILFDGFGSSEQFILHQDSRSCVVENPSLQGRLTDFSAIVQGEES